MAVEVCHTIDRNERVQRTRERAGGARDTVALGTAARVLGLKRGEFELAVQLGEVRTVAAVPAGRQRVAREELERLTAAEGQPGALCARLRVVGAREGAELTGISPGRFTRLARGGFLTPVRFYVNRYGAVVWLYLATELAEFTDERPELLTGRTPQKLREALSAGADQRAARWRSRRVGQLLAAVEDPWERAAVPAAVLPSEVVAGIVDDPFERAYLRELGPALVPPRAGAGSDVVREVFDRVLTADEPREILRHRLALVGAIEDARRARPAPRPSGGPSGAAVTATPSEAPDPGRLPTPSPPGSARRPIGLWARLTGGRLRRTPKRATRSRPAKATGQRGSAWTPA